MTAEAEAEAREDGRSVARRVLFWAHLSCGATAGLIIGLLALTGAALVLERPVLALAAPAVAEPSAPWLSVDELLSRARAAGAGATPTAITLSRHEGTVWVLLGRAGGVGLDGRSGELQGGRVPALRRMFQRLNELHRWLLLSGDARAIGEGITGASTLLFLFLALTGPFLWLPRRWSAGALRRIGWFRRGLRGRARDWNWHHVLGIWCLPVLLVLSASGVVMSYRWANDAVYRLAGTPPPPPGRPAGPKGDISAEGTLRLPLQRLVERATERVPDWRELTVRLEPGGGGRAGPVQLIVRQRDARPRFAAIQLWADPFTGRILREERYADLPAGRKARMWLRFLHTGEALGWPGQLIAGMASLGTVVLVWTGLALALRRLAYTRRSAIPARLVVR
jgi:uncharacterized iron-regulated membrane protein